MNRKSFLLQSVTAGAALVLPSYRSNAQSSNPVPYKPEIVREFVGAGHNKLERVKEMLAEYPNLVYSRWDWGQGDFEEAIEGAGHVGNREIAEYLIQNGARPNMFVTNLLHAGKQMGEIGMSGGKRIAYGVWQLAYGRWWFMDDGSWPVCSHSLRSLRFICALCDTKKILAGKTVRTGRNYTLKPNPFPTVNYQLTTINFSVIRHPSSIIRHLSSHFLL